ncbi:MAG: prepilin-type N-terminal cleavage/methylation domain-containing protein [Syntrophobacteraceae bacterium]
MGPIACRNNKGFTLVEVLVALVILALGLLGSLVGVMAALDSNLGNVMRLEAIKIAQERAEEARNMPYASIQTIASPQTVSRQVRKSMASFTVTTVKTAAAGYTPFGMTKLTITVQWAFKNRGHSYVLETVVRESIK